MQYWMHKNRYFSLLLENGRVFDRFFFFKIETWFCCYTFLCSVQKIPKLIANEMNQLFINLRVLILYGWSDLYRYSERHTHSRTQQSSMGLFNSNLMHVKFPTQPTISIGLLKFTFFRRKTNKKILHYKYVSQRVSMEWIEKKRDNERLNCN